MKTSSFIWHCHLFHCVHTGLIIIVNFSVIFLMHKVNFCLRVFFFCPITKSYVIIIFKFVQNIALYLSINRKQGLCATVTGHKATKNYLLETCRKLYYLREKISSSQMPVVPQVYRADPRASCCSLGSSAFPPGFSFFHINTFVCILVFRHPQDIRRTARLGWSALLSSFLSPLAPSPVSSFSH